MILDGDKPVMSVAEFAHWMGMSERAVYRGVKKGVIPHLRFSRRIAIPKAAMTKLLENGRPP